MSGCGIKKWEVVEEVGAPPPKLNYLDSGEGGGSKLALPFIHPHPCYLLFLFAVCSHSIFRFWCASMSLAEIAKQCGSEGTQGTQGTERIFFSSEIPSERCAWFCVSCLLVGVCR